ncbi:MAG: amidohydrolase [Planctomycetota bacterium]|nr:amidohydrolase [Planctomycetota bacterium]
MDSEGIARSDVAWREGRTAMGRLLWIILLLGGPALRGETETADFIFHGGKVVTVDRQFRIHEALAIRGERVLGTGSDRDVLRLRGGDTRVVDLAGKTVLPGLMDSHTHAPGASVIEFDHPIPHMESIGDVLAYIRARAGTLDDGQWIHVRQVFITRLREQRYPTRKELDEAAPRHPVAFTTGPDASLNSLALKVSGIGKDFAVSDGGPGHAEKDPRTGEPTGILRGCNRAIKIEDPRRRPTEDERRERLRELIRDYNSVGITSIADRSASPGSMKLYEDLLERGELTARVFLSAHVGTIGSVEEVKERIRQVAEHRLFRKHPMLRIGGIKTFLDGGMLTGSAYMRKPWGKSEIYSIDDPEYRGVLFIPREKLLPIVEAAFGHGLQFTAHSVGDGAVHTLLDVYEEIARKGSIRSLRPCITHSNFMSREAVEAMVRLGVVCDIQPAWLYLDTRTLVRQFGTERLRYFQPLRTIFELGAIVGGGSDHMQKIGSLRSVNPYNPFLAMWVTLTRRARWYDESLHPEEALRREQAVRMYTINNAYLLFQEGETGSLEAGKYADFIVIDRDILSSPVDEVRTTRVLETWLGGKKVFELKGK